METGDVERKKLEEGVREHTGKNQKAILSRRE